MSLIRCQNITVEGAVNEQIQYLRRAFSSHMEILKPFVARNLTSPEHSSLHIPGTHMQDLTSLSANASTGCLLNPPGVQDMDTLQSPWTYGGLAASTDRLN